MIGINRVMLRRAQHDRWRFVVILSFSDESILAPGLARPPSPNRVAGGLGLIGAALALLLGSWGPIGLFVMGCCRVSHGLAAEGAEEGFEALKVAKS